MVSITPFGQTGPYKDYKSSDLVCMAMGGMMYLCGEAEQMPLRFSVEQSYPLAGLQAAGGALVAHHYRQATGCGQWLDVSIQESVCWGAQIPVPFWVGGKDIARRSGVRSYRAGWQLPRNIWACKDGHISWRLFTFQQSHFTRALVEWMDEEGMAGELTGVEWENIDFSQITAKMMERWENVIGRFFLKHTKIEIERELNKRGGIAFPLNTAKDLLEHRQLSHRGFYAQVEYSELDTSLYYPRSPLMISDMPRSVVNRAPFVGEHNDEIYGSELSFTQADLAKLRESHVI